MTAVDVRTYRVARSFYDDHVERDLVEGEATVTRKSRSFVDVEMDRDAYDALLSDADYYATEMRDPENVDRHTIALSRSAERVAVKLRAAGAPDPVPADVADERARVRAERDRAEAERAATWRADYEARRAAAKVADDERRAREDAIDVHLLLGIENSGRERDGITPADATRILNERERGHRGR